MKGRRRALAGLAWGAWNAVGGPGARAGIPRDRDVTASATSRSLLWGYYPWWMRGYWRSHDLSIYDRVKFFEIEVGDDGRLGERNGWPLQWAALQKNVRAWGGKVDITITLFSASRFERVFAHPERRSRLLDDILALTRAPDGVQLDVEIFERISPEAVGGYRAFCRQLKAGLQEQGDGKSLSAFGVIGALTPLYDRPTIEHLDHIVVQGYDAHDADSSHAGPVAPLYGPGAGTWESALRHYLSLGAPRQKILFSVPFYGYEWPTDSAKVGAASRGQGRELTYGPVDARLLPHIRTNARAQVAAHGLRRDDATGSPYYTYRDPTGGWWQGWFEDEFSLSAKLTYVQREGLAGIAVFPIGYDNGALDGLLQRVFRGK